MGGWVLDRIAREHHPIMLSRYLHNGFVSSSRRQLHVLRKRCRFQICTEAPYGLAGTMKVDGDRDQEWNILGNRLPFQGGQGGHTEKWLES